jgi:SNF2 family DNA or RNA helicase
LETVTAELWHGRIAVDATYRDKELVRQVPGSRHSPLGGVETWHVPLAWSACLALRSVFGHRLAVGPQLAAWAEHELRTRIHPAMALRGLLDWSGSPDDRGYQRVGSMFLFVARRATLADDMGTGKTRQVLRALQYAGPDALPAVVIAPRAVVRQYQTQGAMTAPNLRVELARGNIAKRRAAIAKTAAGDADVVVMTWAALRSHSRLAPYGSVRLQTCQVCDPTNSPDRKQTSCHRCPRELNAVDWGTVVADEAHNAKDPKAQQTRALWAVAHGLDGPGTGAAYRWALTGTPIADAVDDYWSVGHFLDEDEYPVRSKFIERYGLLAWSAFGGMDVVGIRPETRAEFDGFFEPRFLRRPKALVLPDLPPKIPVEREVELTPKQSRLYRELADEMIGWLDSGDPILATNPLTKTGKLNRVASSYLEARPCEPCGQAGWIAQDTPCPDCGGWGRLFLASEPSSKLDELEEILDELPPDEQVVVFAESRQLIDLAVARLRKRHVSCVDYTGAVPDAVRDEHLRQFMSGQVRVFLATIGAGGTGLDGLQCASVVVFLQRSYSAIANKQAEDRLHRIGQRSSLLVVDVVAVDTFDDGKRVVHYVEEGKARNLADKDDRFEELVRDRDLLRRMLTELRP